MQLGLEKRSAIVTGASRGIGAEIARALAAEGVNVALLGRDTERCESVAQSILAKCPKVTTVVCTVDMHFPDTIAPAVEKAVAALGGCDILVNCAGGATRGRIEDVPDEAWLSNLNVKPLGLVRVTRACLPYLKKSDQARIINIAGTRGREAGPFTIMSSPINLATLGITKTLANDLGPLGITVNAINPGSTDTGRWRDLVQRIAREKNLSEEDAERHLNREVPLGRVVVPQDVANLAVFLASAAASMITGVAINVDGGRSRSI